MSHVRSVFKYRLALVEGPQTFQLPIGAEVLTAQLQHNTPCLWAVVDPDPEIEQVLRTFRVYGTGHPLDRDVMHRYVGTVQYDGGQLIFHIFEIIDVEQAV